MNDSQQIKDAQAEVVGTPSEASIVDTLVDIGRAWADFGVGQGKRALETSAKTLEKVAGSLDELQRKLRASTPPGR